MDIKINKPVTQQYRRFLLKCWVFSIVGFVYRKLTNILKPIFGRKKYVEPFDAFVALYMRQKFNVDKRPLKFKITSSTRPCEGAATQALMTMYAINFSTITGLPYVHSSFHNIAHSDRPLDQWVDEWENYFNLGVGETGNIQSDDEVINLPAVQYQIQYINNLPDLAVGFTTTLAEFRKKYFQRKIYTTNNTGKINISIHIRLGDVGSHQNKEMWTDIASIRTCIDYVAHLLRKNQIEFELNLFSVGKKSDFSNLDNMEINFFLNEDPIWSHQCLVYADILIAAKSNYSYLAALLSQAIVIYEPSNIPGRFTPLDHWLARSVDGKFNSIKFESELKRICHDIND